MQFNNLTNNDSENWSFTGIVSIWVLFSLFGESFGFFLIEHFPSKPEYSYLQGLILNILLLSAFPICMIGLEDSIFRQKSNKISFRFVFLDYFFSDF